jgi:hypothetical protein
MFGSRRFVAFEVCLGGGDEETHAEIDRSLIDVEVTGVKIEPRAIGFCVVDAEANVGPRDLPRASGR